MLTLGVMLLAIAAWAVVVLLLVLLVKGGTSR